MAVPLTLFDAIDRTDASGRDRTEQDFAFLNRSAQPIDQAIRDVVQSWLAKFPENKKKDIRGRFRSDDGHHAGVLLELITHEILNAIGTDIKVDPDLHGLTPDFAATINGVKVLLECTVVQPSGSRLSSDKREAVIKQALDSIDTGRFRLWPEFRRHGPKPPPTKPLKKYVKDWLDTLNPDDEILRIEQGGILEEREWRFEGWTIRIKALPLNPNPDMGKDYRAIGAESRIARVTTDEQIQKSLDKKSEKYKPSDLPYVIVLAHRFDLVSAMLHSIDDNSLVDALLGRIQWLIPTDWNVSEAQEKRGFDGFFGSPEKPQNRRVSAVLFKRCLTLTNPRIPGHAAPLPPWVLYHHPEAEHPLKRGLFPFAADVHITKTPQIAPATCTLSELLSLPIIEEDRFSLKGGLWEAIVG